jgi:hypothetical protein
MSGMHSPASPVTLMSSGVLHVLRLVKEEKYYPKQIHLSRINL